METALADKAKRRAKALGFSTFSAYVVQLIRSDLVSRGEMTVQEMPGAELEPLPPRQEIKAYPKPPQKKKP